MYFRGRKLYGRAVKVPKSYKGVVLVGSQKVLETKREDKESVERGEEEDVEDEEEVTIMEEVGSFNEVLIWGHETVVDAEDEYVRSLEEWIGVAESVSLEPCAMARRMSIQWWLIRTGQLFQQ